MINIKLGEKLKLAREEAGLDQKTAASLLGLDQGKICLIEKGGRKVDAEKELPKFAKAYNKPVSWFFECYEEIPKEKSSIDKFLQIYFSDYNFDDIQKKKIERIMEKSLCIYLDEIVKNSKEEKQRGQRR